MLCELWRRVEAAVRRDGEATRTGCAERRGRCQWGFSDCDLCWLCEPCAAKVESIVRATLSPSCRAPSAQVRAPPRLASPTTRSAIVVSSPACAHRCLLVDMPMLSPLHRRYSTTTATASNTFPSPALTEKIGDLDRRCARLGPFRIS